MFVHHPTFALCTHVQGEIKDAAERKVTAEFLCVLLRFYVEYDFGYLEINPFVVKDGAVAVLDMAAKVDETAHFESGEKWGALAFPGLGIITKTNKQKVSYCFFMFSNQNQKSKIKIKNKNQKSKIKKKSKIIKNNQK